MKALDKILAISASYDVKAETLAAALLHEANGLTEDVGMDQVVVAAKGASRRRIASDVAAVKRKYYDEDVALFIEINRKGLFDTLPQGLFLRLEGEYESPREKTKAIAEQIANARKFFLPFEQALFHPRIEAEQLEQNYTETFPEFIKDIWGLAAFADCLDDRQRFLLCYLLPEAYRIAGNWKLTGLCFEAVLQKPVNLNFIAPQQFENPVHDTNASELTLGDDAIIGESFMDDMPALEVEVKGITYADLMEYLPGGKNRKLLEQLLYSYLIPLDVKVITKILVTEDALGFNLGEAILGYNIQLN